MVYMIDGEKMFPHPGEIISLGHSFMIITNKHSRISGENYFPIDCQNVDSLPQAADNGKILKALRGRRVKQTRVK